MTAKLKNTTPSRQKAAASLGNSSTTGFWAANWMPALVLLLLPILLYAAALSFGYALDDKLVLSENQYVQKGSKGIRDIFGNESLTGFLGKDYDMAVGARYRPLSLATFAIEHQIFGVKPGMSHFINILLYALTALLIYRLLSMFAPGNSERKWYLSVPFIAALLFALHPIHTEVVANIKGRDEILALLLALAAAYYVLRSVADDKAWRSWVAGLLLLLATLAKENAITFMAVVPLLLWAFQKSDLRTIARQMMPLGIATVVYLLIRWSALGFLLDGGQQIDNLLNNPFVEATGSQKSATISLTMAWYLKLLGLPHPLTHDYYPYHVPLVGWGDWRAITGVVSHLALIGLAVWTWRKDKVISFAILYYFITMAVFANIFFPLSLFMNERFLYMPSVAFCLALAWLLCEKLPTWFAGNAQVARGIALAVLAVLGIGYGIRTVTRVPDWENDYTLHAASIEVSPESAFSNQNYGHQLYLKANDLQNLTERKKLLDEALPLVEKALKIFPEYHDALGTKTGIMVGYFQIDNRIEPLLTWFTTVQKTHPLDYVDTVLKDLIAFGQHRVEINYFLQNVGYNYFWVEKGDKTKASFYMQLLKSIDPNNPNVDHAIANIAAGIR